MEYTVWVTGGNGFVGKNLQDYVKKNKIKNFRFLGRKDFDLEDYTQTEDFFINNKNSLPTYILHLAGYVGGVKENQEHQFSMLFRNTQMALNITNICKKFNIGLCSVLSTCIYPYKNIDKALHETMIEQNLELGFEDTNYGYALAKSVLYTQTLNLSKFVDKDCLCIIPTNLFGKYDDSSESGHMIPRVIKKLIEADKKRLDVIDVWGTGQEIRQYLFVEDFCQVLCNLINKTGMWKEYSPDSKVQIYNIIPKNSLKTTDSCIKTIRNVMGLNHIKIQYSGVFSGITKKVVTGRFFESVYSNYRFTHFEDAIEKTWNYIKEDEFFV